MVISIGSRTNEKSQTIYTSVDYDTIDILDSYIFGRGYQSGTYRTLKFGLHSHTMTLWKLNGIILPQAMASPNGCSGV